MPSARGHHLIYIIVVSILNQMETSASSFSPHHQMQCNNNNNNNNNTSCDDFSLPCQLNCGHFNLTHSPESGLTIFNWEHNFDQEDLNTLNDTVDLGDLYENSSITINVCCYDGSYSEFFKSLHVTKLKTLIIDGHVTELSLKNFSSLSFQVQELIFTNGERLPSTIPPEGFSSSLKKVTISQMKIEFIPAGFFSSLSDLISVDIKDNRLLKQVLLPQEMFRDNPRLEFLTISNNICLGDQCSANFDEFTFYYFTNMKEFTFQYTETYSITFKDDSFEEMKNLTKLSLSGVILINNFKMMEHLKNLKNLSLTRVNVSSLNLKHIPKSIEMMCLDESNTFNCSDCVTVNSLYTLESEGKLVVKEDCDNNNNASEKVVLCSIDNNFNMSVYDAEREFCLYNWKPFAITVPLVLVCLISLACYYCFRRAKLEEKRQRMEEKLRPNDAFISFENQDERFVKELQIELEDRNSLRCLIHSRDFVPGERIMKNISDAVESSRTVVIILSKNFLSSNFCEHELSQALSQRRRILMVMRGQENRPSDEEILGHDTIKSHVREFTYLEEDDKEFLRKLVEFVRGERRNYSRNRNFVLYLGDKLRRFWKMVLRLCK